MAKTIDERVVEMRFDNSQFESNAKSTLNTLDKLKQALNFNTSTSAVDNLGRAVKNVDMNSLANAVDTVKVRFSALQIAAVTALQNIVNKAVNAGMQLAKSLTIDPISSGFNEYESKLGSIQTILANTGSSQKQVSQQTLNELNTQAKASTVAITNANKQSTAAMQKAQRQQTKALQKSYEQQLKAYEKKTQKELEAYEEKAQKELELEQETQAKKLEEFDKESQQEMSALQEEAYDKIEAAQKASDAELEAYDKAYQEKLEAYTKELQEETAALEKEYQERYDKIKALQKEETKQAQKSYEESYKALEKQQKQETKAVEDNYDSQYKALQKNQQKEKKLLQDQHKKVLDMYEEEYMAKLKANDEERYKQIKAIDDQIDSLNGLTEAEEAAQKAKEQSQRLEELQANVDSAGTVKEREIAEKELADYKEELALEQAREERERQIDDLEKQKDEINDKYDLEAERIESEYEEQKENEDDLYQQKQEALEDEFDLQKDYLQQQKEAKLDALKEQQEAERDAAKEQQEEAMDAIAEKQEAELAAIQEEKDTSLQALRDKYDAELANMNDLYEHERSQIEEKNAKEINDIAESYEKRQEALEEEIEKERQALTDKQQEELEALQKRQKNEREALQERIQNGREAIQDQQEAAQEALQERQSAELEALNASHQVALQNIETEKQAKIKALQAEAGFTEPSTLEDVNAALDELNQYADDTIYSFQDMTRNIGTFTAAGIGLDDSVDAIKGIANLAALSGSNSNQAANAMYQLSQALATGSLKLMDWNSVVNAGMGGKVFQESLKETAKVHGVAVDEIIAKNGSFRDSLQEGWVTADVLIETLRKFTGDLTKEELEGMGYSEEQIQGIIEMGNTAVDAATKVRTYSQLIATAQEAAGSGWSETFELIFGDFDEATELWTGLSELISGIVDKQADERNRLIKGWKALGGRTNLFDGIKNIWEAILAIVKPVQEAFKEIFPPTTATQLANATRSFKQFTSRLKISDETSDNLKRTFKGLFSIVSIVIKGIKALYEVFKPVIDIVKTLASKILKVTGFFGDFATKLNDVLSENNSFIDVAKGIGTTLSNAFKKAKDAINGLLNPVKKVKSETNSSFSKVAKKAESLKGPFDKIKEVIKSLSDTAKKMASTIQSVIKDKIDKLKLKNLPTVFSGLIDTIKKVPTWSKKALDSLKNWASARITLPDFSKLKEIGKNGLNTAIEKLKEFSKSSENGVKKLKGFIDAIKDFVKTKIKAPNFDFIKGIGDTLKSSTSSIKDAWSKMKKSFSSITSGFSGFKTNLKPIVDKIKDFLSNFSENFDNIQRFIKNTLLILIGYNVNSAVSQVKNTFKKLGDSFSEIKGIFKSISKGIGDTFDAIKNRIKYKDAIKVALAIGIIAAALYALSTRNWDEIAVGMTGLLGALTILSGGMFLISKIIQQSEGINASNGIGLVALASAILILAKAIIPLSSLDLTSLAKGVGAIGGLLVEMGVFVKLSEKASNMMSTAAGMIIMAEAIKLMVDPVNTFAQMDLLYMAQGLAGVGAILLELGGFARLAGNASNMISVAAGMVILAEALKLMEEPLDYFAYLPIDMMIQGLAGVGVMLGEMGAFSRFAGNSEHMISVAAGMVILAEALKIMEQPLTFFQSSGFVSMIPAFADLAVVLGEFVLALRLLPEDTLSMGAGIALMAGAMAIMGQVLGGLAGLDLGQAAVGLSELAVALALFVAAAMVIDGLGITSSIFNLGKAMVVLGLGTAAMGIGLGALAASAELILASLPLIVELLKQLIPSVCDVIIDSSPKIAEAVVALMQFTATKMVAKTFIFAKAILEILKTLVDYVPDIVSVAMDLAIAAINAFNEKLPDLMEALKPIFDGIVEGIRNLTQDDLIHGLEAIGFISGLMVAMAGLKMIGTNAMIGLGEAAAVVAELGAILAAFGALNQIPGLNWIIGEGGDLLATIGNAIGKFAGSVIGGIGEGVTSSMPIIGTNLSEFINNAKDFIEGIGAIDSSHAEGAAALAKAIVTVTASDVIGGLLSLFGSDNSLSNFKETLTSFGEAMKGYSDIITSGNGIDASAIKASATAGSMIAELADNLPNSGGWFGAIFGENDLDTFASQLKKFGYAIKTYSDVVTSGSGIDEDAVAASTRAGQMISDLADSLPNSGGLIGAIFGENDLDTFASQLTKFGYAIKTYSDVVTSGNGIDEDAVAASTRAGQMISDLANTLPDEGGVVGFLFGDNSLSTFAANLDVFGPAIKDYSDTVSDGGGIKVGAVQASANAGKMLASLASVIPDDGGLLGIIFGNETGSLSEFAENIKAFGPAIKEYSDTVSADGGIKTAAVEASKNAADVLVGLSEELPSDGGVFDTLHDWLFGDNSLASFATQLEAFAPGMKAYLTSISGVGEDDVTASNAAIQALVDASTTLADNDGGWFSSNTDLSDFGSSLQSFGGYLSVYYNIIKELDITKFNNTTTAIQDLIDISNELSNDSTTLLNNFAIALKNLGSNGIKEFAKSFTDSETTVSTAVETMISYATEKLESSKTSVGDVAKEIGEKVGSEFNLGIDYNLETVNTKVQTFGDSVVTKLRESLPFDTFLAYGKGMAGQIASGIEQNTQSAVDKTFTLCDGILGKISDTLRPEIFSSTGTGIIGELIGGMDSQESSVTEEVNTIVSLIAAPIANSLKPDNFNTAGASAISGLSAGIASKQNEVYTQATNLSNLIGTTVKGIVSYQNFYNIGTYVAPGLANGILANRQMVIDAAANLANSAITTTRTVLDEHSPSKVAEELGSNFSTGLANGVIKTSSDVTKATSFTSGLMIAQVGDALDNFVTVAGSSSSKKLLEVLNNFKKDSKQVFDGVSIEGISVDIDPQLADYKPIITPSLDLSQVVADSSQIPGILNGSGLSASLGLSQAAASTTDSKTTKTYQTEEDKKWDMRINKLINGFRENAGNYKMTNNYNIENDDPNEVAKKVSKILQKQVEKGKAAWAK